MKLKVLTLFALTLSMTSCSFDSFKSDVNSFFNSNFPNSNDVSLNDSTNTVGFPSNHVFKKVNDVLTLTAYVVPTDFSGTLTWSSSNSSKVSVTKINSTQAQIKCIASFTGTVTITVKESNSNRNATCKCTYKVSDSDIASSISMVRKNYTYLGHSKRTDLYFKAMGNYPSAVTYKDPKTGSELSLGGTTNIGTYVTIKDIYYGIQYSSSITIYHGGKSWTISNIDNVPLG